MKPLFLLLLLLSLLAACGRTHVPLSWPCEADRLDFTGILHASRADIPIQGALQKHRQEIRYAVIIQNGILLGTGRIDPSSGRATAVQHARDAGPVVTHIGKVLALFLDCSAGHHDAACSWKRIDKHSHFHDKRLEIVIPLQDTTCRDLK